MSFHANEHTFYVHFYIVSNFALRCDALLGFDALARHDISIYPKNQALCHKGTTYYATDNPVSVLTVTPQRAHFEKSPLPSVGEPSPSFQGDQAPFSPVESKQSDSTSGICAAVVIGDQYIAATSSHRIPVRIRKAPVGSCVVSHPDSARVQRLALEGTLSSIRDDHVTDTLDTNVTGSSVTLKDGVHLGSFTIVDEASFQDSVPLIAAVSTQPALNWLLSWRHMSRTLTILKSELVSTTYL